MHSAQSPAPATYLGALDGLRAVSIAMVIASHLGLEKLVPGAFGVTLFFFISGYLITRQLAASLAGGGGIAFGRFYGRRALRLMPAALTYIVVAGGGYTLAGGHISPGGWAAAALYGANYYDLFSFYHSTLAGVRHPFNILWSLAIEEHFYMLWPLALVVLWRRGLALPGLVLLCGVVLLWRASLMGMCFHPGAPGLCGPANPNPLWRYNRLYLATDTRLDSIAFGAILALLPWAHLPRGRGVWLGCLGLLALSFALPGPWGRHVLRPTLQGVSLLGLFPVLLEPESRIARVLRQDFAVRIGRLSYSLYLWHWAALGLADGLAPQFSATWLAIALPVTAALALLSYHMLERPVLRLRQRLGSHATG